MGENESKKSLALSKHGWAALSSRFLPHQGRWGVTVGLTTCPRSGPYLLF